MTGKPTADDVITQITEAPTDEQAHEIINATPAGLVRAVADQLYVETEGHGMPWIRRECIREARS